MSLTDVPMSASARQHFQQYLSQLPTSSSGAGSSKTAPSDPDELLRQATILNRRTDELHARLAEHESAGTDDPQLFWTTVSLLSNLRDVSVQLGRANSDRRTADALARTRQNVAIAESMLSVLSVSGTTQASGPFTAPLQPTLAVETPGQAPSHTERKGYESWRQEALAGIDDDASTTSTLGYEESDAESVLTDPEIHAAPSKPAVALGGIRREEDDDDLSEYDRGLKLRGEASAAATTATTGTNGTAGAPGASETILQSDRATHEALSSELLRMASVLKTNSLAFADALERDRVLLEKAGTDLGQNLDLMTRTRGRLGVYSKKARSMGWFTLSAILVVMVSWMLMFLLIRLT